MTTKTQNILLSITLFLLGGVCAHFNTPDLNDGFSAWLFVFSILLSTIGIVGFISTVNDD